MDTEKKQGSRPERIPAKEQPKDRLYEMSVRFVADIMSTEINGMLDFMGMDEKPVLQNAVTLRLTQTIPFIPDDETLAKYADILKNSAPEGATYVNIRFDGYDYLYAVKPTDNGEPA